MLSDITYAKFQEVTHHVVWQSSHDDGWEQIGFLCPMSLHNKRRTRLFLNEVGSSSEGFSFNGEPDESNTSDLTVYF